MEAGVTPLPLYPIKERIAMNALADFFKSQEDRERLKKIEQLRRKGERFIRVKYEGPIIPQIEGLPISNHST